MIQIHTFHAQRGCLSYLVVDTDTLEGILIDPSIEMGEEYTDTLQKHSIKLTAILETHTHADHISSAWQLKEQFQVPVGMSIHSPSKRKDLLLKEGDTLPLGQETLTVWHTPGHTSESLMFVLPGHVFTGDTLLIGGTGRTDFQAGSSEALYDSLSRLLPLPEETVVHPGHNYKGRTESTLQEERQKNPRLSLVAAGDKEAFITLMDNHKPPLPELFTESIQKNSL